MVAIEDLLDKDTKRKLDELRNEAGHRPHIIKAKDIPLKDSPSSVEKST